MEQPHAIDVLDVALLEIEPEGVFLGEEMDGVQRLGLRLADGRDVRAPHLRAVPREVAARVLDDDVAVLVVQNRALRVGGVPSES